MTAFNIVRFRVKPGHQGEFVAAHRQVRHGFKGFRGGSLVKTGDQTYCIVGEWVSFKALANARAQMIAILDSLRPHLEDLGGGLGVTDPVSGEVVVKVRASPATKTKAKKKTKTKKKVSAKRKKRR